MAEDGPTPLTLEWTRTLTVGGLPGTGTTTACRALAALSGLKHVYAGEMFRGVAAKKGMTLAEFSAHAERHPEFDRELDAHQAQILQGPPVILEGRLSGYLAYRDKVPAVKVWFTCDPYVRAKRVVEREGGDVESKLAEMRRREDSERKRYLAFYGFDLSELSFYDLVLNTAQLSREGVVEAVLQEYGKRTKRAWWAPWRRA